MCLAQGPQRSDAGEAPRSRVKHSTTELLRSLDLASNTYLGTPVATAATRSKAAILLLLVCWCSVFGLGFMVYSLTCLKRPLKNRQKKGLKVKL